MKSAAPDTLQRSEGDIAFSFYASRAEQRFATRQGSTIASNYNATGSMLGYLYQCREALLVAIVATRSKPSLSVSIERFDDVAFEQNGTATELLQLKHHVRPASLTDMSVDLWKTLRIWSEAVAADPQMPFERRFSIITTAQAPAGSAAELLRANRPYIEAEKDALALLKAAASTSTSRETAAGRRAFLALSDRNQENLLAAIHIHDQAPSITNARSEIEEQLYFSAPDGKVTDLVDHLEGWWFSQVVACLADVSSPAISLLALRAKIDEIARAFRNKELLISPEALAVTVGDLPKSDGRTFVRQMRCVDIAEESIELAKLDFYRATAQRSTWARENALLDGEAARYDADLVERWKRERLARESSCKPISDDEKKSFGRDLFHWASRAQAPFRNRHEQWLCTGSYQILSDGVTIGWHPDHSTMFDTSAKDEAA